MTTDDSRDAVVLIRAKAEPSDESVRRLWPRVRRNMSTPASRAWWEAAKRIAAKCRDWPASRRAGINVSDRRTPPTPERRS